MAWFSFHAVLEKYNLIHVDVASYLFIFTFTGMVFLWAVVALQRVDVKENIRAYGDRTLYAMVVARAISAYSYVYAVRSGSVAVINYVSGMSVVLVVLLGVYVLGEKDNLKRKLVAVAVALVGLTLIAVGSRA